MEIDAEVLLIEPPSAQKEMAEVVRARRVPTLASGAPAGV
jgi:hypothetical protein